MSLFLVATPIGNPEDITLRALRCLREAELVIGEERKEVSKLLKSLDLTKPIELLNEHSDVRDYEFLASECAIKKVVLVSDCGTPGFCDPGAELVALCRKRGIAVIPVPGASSLMGLIAGSGVRLNEFYFRGFLPAKQELRGPALKRIANEKKPVVVMDTPYRLSKLLAELSQLAPNRRATLAVDLTQPTERILEAPLSELAQGFSEAKHEFMLLLHELAPIEKGLRKL